jgi:hypothetical protein
MIDFHLFALSVSIVNRHRLLVLSNRSIRISRVEQVARISRCQESAGHPRSSGTPARGGATADGCVQLAGTKNIPLQLATDDSRSRNR